MELQPIHVFLIGISLLALFVWYFAAETFRRRRLVGSVLGVFLSLFCLYCLKTQPLNKGVDLQGGMSFTVQLDPVIDPETGKEKPISPAALEEVIGIMQKRLDPDGTQDLRVQKQGVDRVIIEMPGITNEEMDGVREKIKRVAKLEFRLVHPESASILARIRDGGPVEPGWVEMQPRDKENDLPLMVRNRADLEGRYVNSAYAFLSPQTGWTIQLSFDSEGSGKFGELTAAHVNERLAVVIDGEIISAPNLNEAIYGGSAIISGSFKEMEARELANGLENPLSNPLQIVQEASTDPIYGRDTIRQGIFAGVAGLTATLLFMIVYYRVAGIIALVGLAVNILLLFGAMTIFGFTLTMPGIAGILLTIGIAIDANVLIYERLREELNTGRSLWSAVQAAYEKAFSAIFDANVTTLITALILFMVASGTIKGFAVTLTVGIFASLFAALLVTRVCYGWLVRERAGEGAVKGLSFLSLLRNQVFEPLAKRRVTMVISIGLVIFSLGMLVVKGENNFGIDFRGGDLISYSLKQGQSFGKQEVDAALQGLQVAGEDGTSVPLGEYQVQRQSGAGGDFVLVRAEPGAGDAVVAKLAEDVASGVKYEKSSVGPTVGREFAISSGLALVLGLLGILLYVTLRFEFAFAIGALIALLHDIVITFGIVSLAGREVSLMLVGAFLTIAGYSINDTIVVFDRIRELLKTKKGNVEKIMNLAISNTLNRTLLTSLTTLVMVGTLYIFGGPSLKDFAFTIIIGVVIGTYSSIFVASPIVLWWSARQGRNLRKQVLATEAEREQLRKVRESGIEIGPAPEGS
jgi:SecD/SecF fusion protein